MSLPTYAVFYDKNGIEIARQFVNVGWWVDEDNFADAVLNLPVIYSAKTIQLYGITINTKSCHNIMIEET